MATLRIIGSLLFGITLLASLLTFGFSQTAEAAAVAQQPGLRTQYATPIPPTSQPSIPATQTLPPTATQFPPSQVKMDVVGQIGGISLVVAVQGNYLYLGVGPRLVVMSLANPRYPRPIWQSEILPDIVEEIAVRGPYLVVGAGTSLTIFDASKPSSPKLISHYEKFGVPIHGLAIQGTKVYVGLGDCEDGPCHGGLRIIDIADPNQPTLVGALGFANYVSDLTVAGNYVYLSISYADIRVIDVSIPAKPRSINFPKVAADSIQIVDNLAYMSSPFGYAIADISDPENAQLLTTFGNYKGYVADLAMTSQKMVMITTYCDIGSCSGNLFILDAADPHSPQGLGGAVLDIEVNSLTIVNNIAYVATDSGLSIVDISDLQKPFLVRELPSPGMFFHLASFGDRLYAVDINRGVSILDISNPPQPKSLGFYNAPACQACFYRAGGIAALDNKVYLTTADTNISILTASNPGTLSELGFLPGPTGVGVLDYIAAAGQYLYTYGQGHALMAIDARHYGSLSVVASLDSDHAITAHDFKDDYIYALESYIGGDKYQSAFSILKMTNKQLQRIGQLPLAGVLQDVKVQGQYAYVTVSECLQACAGQGSLWVIDISNPALPQTVSFTELSVSAYRLSLQGKYAYLVTPTGLQIVDISHVNAPVIAGQYISLNFINDMEAKDGYIYLAVKQAGLVVLQPEPVP